MAVPGLTTIPSAHSVVTTIDRLVSLVQDRGMIVFSRIDHAAAAAQVGLTMRATQVLLFGGPKAGTPLMQKAPTLAIDLPLKAMAWEDESGAVWLSWNDPIWLIERHAGPISLVEDARAMKAGVEKLAAAAAG